MQRMARFMKVSYPQFEKDWLAHYPDTLIEEVQQIYEDIQLPKRATRGSAGHDFYVPVSTKIACHQAVVIPTGIRVWMEPGWLLQNYPRSSLGFKYRLQMCNTVGIIDSDYFEAANEGHIISKVTNASLDGQSCPLQAGDRFMQGIFVPFGITLDDDCEDVRSGGFGSTNQSS